MNVFEPDMRTMVMAIAMICSIAFGFCAYKTIFFIQRSRRHKASLDSATTVRNRRPKSITDAVIELIVNLSRNLKVSGSRRIVPADMARSSWFDSHALKAGLDGIANATGYCEAKARLALLGAMIGFVLGLIFSAELSVVLAIVGSIVGFELPPFAIKSQISMRANETERHLPEMLEVVALGIRSGLSFDSSLHLYAEHFDCSLSRELANSQRQWSSGLTRREEALRRVAASYDSVILSRVVETIIRSVRYGSTMAKSLEEDAAEAREAYKSRREERVAKAPVKMMIPTGVLILPAMLILVLGPVLLELMGGGI